MAVRVLEEYLNIVLWDVDKMAEIAQKVEENNNSKGPVPYSPSFTTQNPNTHNSEVHTAESARCTIPIAMALTSAVEFVGSLINAEKDIWGTDFIQSVKNVFKYADLKFKNDDEIKIYKEVYRNGLMHHFFPKGLKVAINYDSRFKNKEIMFSYKGNLELNVYVLHRETKIAFKRVLADPDIQPIIERRINFYLKEANEKQKYLVDKYLNLYLP